MEHPFLVADRLIQFGKITDRRGVEQKYAGPSTEDLDEVGPLRISKARGPLGIDGDRAMTGGDGRNGFEVFLAGLDDVHFDVGCLFKLCCRVHDDAGLRLYWRFDCRLARPSVDGAMELGAVEEHRFSSGVAHVRSLRAASTLTPSTAGGSPASMHSNSPQPSTCEAIS